MAPDPSATDELLARVRNGDAEAVERLLTAQREPLRRMIGARLDPALAARVDASDVVQDVLLEAHRRLNDYLRNPVMPFGLWLRHIAKDHVIDAHRRQGGIEAGADKAAGAIRRLDSEGQSLRIAAPTLNDPNVAADIEQLKGKIVVVYYWASWNTQCANDFTKLRQLLEATKGVELMCVNLDTRGEDAKAFLMRQGNVPGVQLYQPGGQESKLATDYGIMSLPSLFLVNRDGKVVSRTVQVTTLEDEIKKLNK